MVPAAGPSGLKKFVVAVLLSVVTSSQGLITTATKVGGKYLYDPATVPLLSETVKLIVSAVLLKRDSMKDPHSIKMTGDWRTWCLFPVPSLIYLVHNNLQFLILHYLDPSTYQIMGNLKIVTTGIFFRLMLKRRLSMLQWLALLLLTVAAVSSQLTGCQGTLFSAPIMGYLLGILSACLSGMAGVYTEYLLKKNDDCLYWQNIQLYSFGVAFNFMHLVFNEPARYLSASFWVHGEIFTGYSFLTYCVVCTLAFSGLLVSWLMKFADNIIKVYATSMAMVVTMMLSLILFRIVPTIQVCATSLGRFCSFR
eukprot:jgi/Mesvir1/27785/Mv07467-RA.1